MISTEVLVDVPFMIARLLMIIAVLCFMVYFLFLASALVLTWRPAGKKKQVRAETIRAAAIQAHVVVPGKDTEVREAPETEKVLVGTEVETPAVVERTSAGTRGRHRLTSNPSVRPTGEERIAGAA